MACAYERPFERFQDPSHEADNRRTVTLPASDKTRKNLSFSRILVLTAKMMQRSIRRWVVKSGRKWVQPRSEPIISHFSRNGHPPNY
jgi:hypothetical protein